MTTGPTSSDSGDAGRVRCAYCGANNFPQSAACWKCGRPLRPLSASSPAPPFASGAPQPPPVGAAPGYPFSAPRGIVLSATAPKAAAALGLFFPWAGGPIGLVFLMFDDPVWVRLGWIALGWSIVSTVLSIVGFVGPALALLPLIKGLASHSAGSMPGGGLSGSGLGGSGL